MTSNGARLLPITSFLTLAIALTAGTGWGQTSGTGPKDANSACSTSVATDVPQASISNGPIYAVVYLPDAKNGYYRSSRFDWSGVIPCLTYKGHNYFGIWFPQHDPLVADSLTGPVEEFRSADGALGYNDAEAGGVFVKPGIGILRKVDDAPYKYNSAYTVLDAGEWTIRTKKTSVTMKQRLQSPVGYSYDYQKVLRLDGHQPVLVIEHVMKNTGTKTIDSDVYDHDFYTLDGAPTGPGMVIHFPFVPIPSSPLEPGAEIVGKDIVYKQELLPRPRGTVTAFLSGFSNKASDYDFTFENRDTGTGVEQTSDSPMSNFNLWSIRTTVAPEAYIHVHIAPGETQRWSIRYRFFAKDVLPEK